MEFPFFDLQLVESRKVVVKLTVIEKLSKLQWLTRFVLKCSWLWLWFISSVKDSIIITLVLKQW